MGNYKGASTLSRSPAWHSTFQHEEGPEAQVDARGGRLPRVPRHVQAVHQLSPCDGTLELPGQQQHRRVRGRKALPGHSLRHMRSVGGRRSKGLLSEKEVREDLQITKVVVFH